MIIRDMDFCLEEKLNWLYIDINSYFATVEQQLNSNLRNKPVIVVPMLADSTCALAASYEAKTKGIKTGTRVYEAKKLCPDVICIVADHRKYVKYHKKIFQEIDLYLKVDHIFSIDEGACRLTGKYCNKQEAISIAKIIKEAIKKNVGEYINCSVGIAPNRYLAKIASNMQKPDGLIVIEPEELPEKLYSLKLSDLPGLGSKTRTRLMSRGVSSIEQLCKYGAKELKSLWGNIWGEKVWYLIRGADLPIEKTVKSTIGHSQVLAPNKRNIDSARSCIMILTQKATHRLRDKNLYCNSVVLTLKLNRSRSIKTRTNIAASSDNEYIQKHVLVSWDKMIRLHGIKYIIQISIALYGLQEEPQQLSFGDEHKHKNRQKISEAVDLINHKLGKNTVSIGVLPKKHKREDIIAFSHIPK